MKRRPAKPSKPVAPKKMLTVKRQFDTDDAYLSIYLSDILVAMNLEPGEFDPAKLKIDINGCDSNNYFGDYVNFSITYPESYKRYNPNYIYEKKKYDKAMVKYKQKLVDWEIKLADWEEERANYDKLEAEKTAAEERKMYKRLKEKYE